ncbi:MAG: M48 family metalloprotease [Planctomycetota bacterium]
MYFRLALLGFALIGLVATGCCIDPINGEQYFCLTDMSEEQEIELGRAYAPDFAAQSGGAYPDAELQRYLTAIVLDLAANSHRPGLPWNFTILNTSQINAFALPGGEVFVTRGLLARLDTEAQFAQLMGHEIGHVTHRHAVRGQNRAALFQLILGAAALADQHLTDPDSPPLIAGATGMIGQLAMLHYSREQELQSDSRGIDYAIASGYDPREARKTFELFLELKQASGHTQGLVEELLSTHPPDEKRISEIDEYIAHEYPHTPVDTLVVSGRGWAGHKSRIRAAQQSYAKLDEALALVEKARAENQLGHLDQAESLIREGGAALTGHAPFPAALGLIALERDDTNEASLQLDRACRLDPDYFQGRYYRGLVHLRRKAYTEAASDMTAANRLYPSNPLPCYHLGAIAENEGKKDAAIEWYGAVIGRSTAESRVHQLASERLAELQGETTAVAAETL